MHKHQNVVPLRAAAAHLPVCWCCWVDTRQDAADVLAVTSTALVTLGCNTAQHSTAQRSMKYVSYSNTEQAGLHNTGGL
jgi:hypothetical protein